MEGSVAPKTLRAVATGIVTAVTVGCLRDIFARPFSTESPFRPWIADPWRSAYPWACAATAILAALLSRRGKSDLAVGPLAPAWVASLLLARVAAPPFYALVSSLIPAPIRDDVLVPFVFAGLELETLLPIAVFGALGLAGLHVVARRAGGGWPTRGRHGRIDAPPPASGET